MAELDPTHPIFRRWVIFNQAHMLFIKHVERNLADWDLSLPQYLTLYLLKYTSKPVSPTVLARYLSQETQSVTSLLDRMENRGLVYRTKDPTDRRGVWIMLGEEGRRIIDEAMPHAFGAGITFFSAIPEEEQIQLETVLRHLRDRVADNLGLDPSKLDYAADHLDRDPDMWVSNHQEEWQRDSRFWTAE